MITRARQQRLHRGRAFYRALCRAGYKAGLLVALLLAGQAATAANENVVTAVTRFLERESRQLGSDVSVEVIPPGARFPACPSPQPFFPGNGQRRWGRVTVGVRCDGDSAAQRYLQARVSVTVRYWVTARALPAGTLLEQGQLSPRSGDLADLPRHVIRSLDAISGQVTRRPLARGTVLQQTLLETPAVVERRQAVAVEASGSGFRIAREGRALDEGARGDSIRVRMPDREILTGRVIGPGRVAVNW